MVSSFFVLLKVQQAVKPTPHQGSSAWGLVIKRPTLLRGAKLPVQSLVHFLSPSTELLLPLQKATLHQLQLQPHPHHSRCIGNTVSSGIPCIKRRDTFSPFLLFPHDTMAEILDAYWRAPPLAR